MKEITTSPPQISVLARKMTARTQVLIWLLALLLCAWQFVSTDDPMFLLTPFAESLPESLQVLLCAIVIPLMLLYAYSFMLGTGICAFFLWRRVAVGPATSHAFFPLLLPLLCILWLALQAAPFLRVPAGTHIRPMNWTACTFGSAVLLTVFSIIRSIAAFREGKNKFVCSVAMLLSVAMIIVPSLSLIGVARLEGFGLSP
jgi:hypothetical protein